MSSTSGAIHRLETKSLELSGPIAAAPRRFWPLLYWVILSTWLFVAFFNWAYDDPFITYRYADNLRHGLGFVYNLDEHVLSTTTPLFTLLLAALGMLWNDLPHLATLVGALSLSGGALLLWDLGRSWKTPWVGWTALLLYPTFSLLLSTLGSEIPLYLAFCIGSFAFYARERYQLASVFGALAVLTRPDAAVVPFILASHYLARRKTPIPWRAVFTFLALTLPWFLFSWAYFGSAAPATLAAKQHQGTIAESQQFVQRLIPLLQAYMASWQYQVEGGLVLVVTLQGIRATRSWATLLAWPALNLVTYSVLGVSSYFWYYASLVPALVVGVGLGLSLAVEGANRLLFVLATEWEKAGPPEAESLERSAARTKFVGMAASALLLILAAAQGGNGLWQQERPVDEHFEIYRAVGEWLDANTPPQAVVGTLEAGIVGYYAHRRMVDFAGLLQPKVAAQLTAATDYEDAALWAVQSYHPDYIVHEEDTMPRLEGEYLWYRCWPAQYFSRKEYHAEGDISIYFCP